MIPKTVGIVAKPECKEACKHAADIGYWLVGQDIEVWFLENTAANLNNNRFKYKSETEIVKADLLVTLGGDGTVLYWAGMNGTAAVLPVNYGHYGFITEVEPDDILPALGEVLNGNNRSYSRSKVLASSPYGAVSALNEVSLRTKPGCRLSPVGVEVDDEQLGEIHATEILVATPTGSTGHSLSAGGPIVHPDMKCLIITPVCPHTLNSRPVVVPDTHRIKLITTGPMILCADGQECDHIPKNTIVKVTVSFDSITTLRPSPGFYDKLRRRMRWGERF